jgi:hypothetical protein
VETKHSCAFEGAEKARQKKKGQPWRVFLAKLSVMGNPLSCSLRWMTLLVCLGLVMGGPGAGVAEAAHHKKKSGSGKKPAHKTEKKPSKPGSGSAPAAASDDDSGDDASEADEKEADAPKFKAKKAAKVSEDAGKNDEGGDGKDSGDGDEDAPVVRKKARGNATDEGPSGAPVAVELSAGPRAVHRTFDFNDPLSDFQPAVPRPYSYVLPAAPAPFVEAGIYPMAFMGAGFAAHIGLVGSYERMIGTKSVLQGTTPQVTLNTSGQQFDVGLRGRIPLGPGEVGVVGTFGKHSFHVTDTDAGPAAGSVLPNIDYTFVRAGVDGRTHFGPVVIGAHVGTRLVTDTGPLKAKWFPSTKTTSIEAGASVGYRLTSLFEVVGGVDFLRYAFAFSPKVGDPVIAGGAVDQYISGWLALRVSITGG